MNESVRPKLQSSADVVLRNLPNVKPKVMKKIKEERKEEGGKIDVEAMFAGM